MRWDTTTQNFEILWKALIEKADKYEPEVTKSTKQMNVTKWVTDFENHIHAFLGITKSPLAYITRASNTVPTIGIWAANISYYTEHGLIEDKLITRVPHTHLLYHNDNEYIYEKLEIPMRNI